MLDLRRPFAVSAALLALVACGRSDRSTTDSANGSVTAQRAQVADTGNPLSVTPAAGMAQVTATDAKSVTKATEYRLTDDNFRRFIQATDSLTALKARDPQARAFLDEQISDAGNGTKVTDTDAGWKHLESNPAVNNAITSAGISVRDYFVASIAIAQAERFMGNPKAAPPTPALAPNAEFLDAHKAELSALRSRSGGTSSTR
jgi:major membrane immunogen (membrane-anchored lipoprotein)